MTFGFHPVPKPPKQEKVNKPWSRSSIKPKRTKQKYVKSAQAQRNDFSPFVRKRKKADTQGICEYCNSRRGREMHHVVRRGKGRGCYTNAMYLCFRCHHEIVHADRSIEDKLKLEYELTYGKYYFMDERDIEAIPQHERDKVALRKWEHFNQIRAGE